MSRDNGADAGYELVLDFGIDGPDFTAAEALAFCLGFEFGLLYRTLESDPWTPVDEWVHSANADRIIALCRQLGRECTIVRVDDDWSHLTIDPAD